MDKSELYRYAIQEAVRMSGHDIDEVLLEVGGDIDAAMKLLGDEYCEYEHTTWGQRLGTWASTGPGKPRVDAFGSARTHPIRVWYPENKDWQSPADLLLPWRDVFEFYVQRQFKPVQLDLFGLGA